MEGGDGEGRLQRVHRAGGRGRVISDEAIHPRTRGVWRRWLERHHARAEGVWLVSYKKGTGRPRVDYDAAVEEALCFGWVDSTARKLDDERTMLYFAPRKPRSGWAGSNKARVERLIAAGLMAPAGLAKVEAARRDGSWTALDGAEALAMPPDLRRALKARPPAARCFEAFPPGIKRSILQWIASAKKPETRAKRVDETARLAAQNIRANQWQPS